MSKTIKKTNKIVVLCIKYSNNMNLFLRSIIRNLVSINCDTVNNKL